MNKKELNKILKENELTLKITEQSINTTNKIH